MTKQECTRVEYKSSSGIKIVEIEDTRGDRKSNTL